MAPLSYALLDEVLQFPQKIGDENTPRERVTTENPNNFSQNTNIIKPNASVFYPRMVEHFTNLNDFNIFSSKGYQVEDILKEQLFLTKIMLILVLFTFLINFLER